MKQKTLIILSSILVPLLLVGVGFSTYAIALTATATATGNITAEGMGENSKKIEATLDPIAFINDSANSVSGFISTDHTASSTANLTAKVTFTGFSDNTKTFNFILSDTTGKFVNSTVLVGAPACTCTTDPTSVGSSVGNNTFDTNTNKLTNVITFTSLSSPFTATVSYALTYSTEIVEDSSISLTVEEA